MAKKKITLVRSTIGCLPSHRATVKSLGLRRIRHSVVRESSPSLEGQLRQVAYLIQVEETN